MRRRATLRGLMVVVAAVALVLGAVTQLPPMLRERSNRLASARELRWRESHMREGIARIAACPERATFDPRRAWADCPGCSRVWPKPRTEFAATHEQAESSLRWAAAVLARAARRAERGAARPWAPMPPRSPAEESNLRILMLGNGPIYRKYFDVL